MSSETTTLSTKARPPAVALLVVFALLVVVAVLTEVYTWTAGHTHLHTVMEVPAVVIAALVGVLALMRFYALRNDAILLLGAGFLGTAFLDGYHALVTSAAFDQFFPSPPASLIPWSWTAPRLFLGVLMVSSWWAWKQYYEEEGSIRWQPRTVYLSIGVAALATFGFFAFVPLGPAYVPGTLFGRPQEFLTASLYLAAFVGYWFSPWAQSSPLSRWILASLLVSAFSQGAVMARSQALFDTHFDVAHLLKMASYLLVLCGLLNDVYLAWSRDRTQKAALKALTDELSTKNRHLERSNAEMRQFTYIASHDLQTPLREMSGAVQMIEFEAGKDLNESARHWVGHAVESVQQMHALVQGLATYTEAEQRALPFEEVALDEVIAHVVATLQPSIDAAGAHVTVGTPLPSVRGDRAQLAQVFSELIGNALKFRGSAPPAIQVAGERTHQEVRVWVEDEGLGIDPAYHGRIFDVFVRLHTRQAYPGTGMGLAVARRIARRHGGELTVASKNGRGSKFLLTLPNLELQRESS